MGRRAKAIDLLALGLLAGCGPSVEASGAAGGGQSTSMGSTTGTGRGGSGGSLSAGTSQTTAGGTGTSTSAPAETADAESSEGPGAGFVDPRPEGGSEDDCRPIAQDCAEGFKCVWYAPDGSGPRRDHARCIPVTGDREPFESCSLPTGFGPDISDDCGADSYCLEVYGTAEHGYCAPFLGLNCDAYPEAQAVVENGSDFPAACLVHPCDPLDASTCPEETRCMYYPASLYANAVCWREDEPADLPLGAACDFGSCGEGRLCADSAWLPSCDHDRCCAQWCDINAEEACDVEGTSCERFFISQATDDAFDNVGACLLPDVFR